MLQQSNITSIIFQISFQGNKYIKLHFTFHYIKDIDDRQSSLLKKPRHLTQKLEVHTSGSWIGPANKESFHSAFTHKRT